MIQIKKRYLWIPILLFIYAGLRQLYVTPIIMYHHIDNRSGEWKLSVSPESFKRQMEFLKAHQYRVISLGEYIDGIKKGKRPLRKSVVITFDDGYSDNFTAAYPVLTKLKLPATIFVQVDGIGREGYMTEEDIAILTENGIDIGSHTLHHSFLPELTLDEMRIEIRDSRRALEKLTGALIEFFSYPGGGLNENAVRLVKEAGYLGAVSTHKGPHLHTDAYQLRRIRISRTCDNLVVFWLKISGFYTYIEEIRG